MMYIPEEEPWAEEDHDMMDTPRAGIRSATRRERTHGLGIQGIDMTTASSQGLSLLKTGRRRISARRSIIALFAKSSEPQTEKRVSSQDSASRSSYMTTPEASTASPDTGHLSNYSKASLVSQSSTEDITTYHTNLARFKAERAQRAAELGISEQYDMCRPESSTLQRLHAREEDTRKSSGLGLSRGLRAYWGGGTSSESKSALHDNANGKISEVDLYDEYGTDNLKAWWDKLG